jgi:hypothetical protein
MKHRWLVLALLAIALVLAVSSAAAEPAPNVTFRLDNPPPANDPLELAVGESHTFYIEVSSDQPFTLAMAMTDAYYPGRGVFWHGVDVVVRDDFALLELTITGKSPTSELAAVCDWPQPGDCWPEGVVPLAIAAGARFAGGATVSEIFPFSVVVY